MREFLDQLVDLALDALFSWNAVRIEGAFGRADAEQRRGEQGAELAQRVAQMRDADHAAIFAARHRADAEHRMAPLAMLLPADPVDGVLQKRRDPGIMFGRDHHDDIGPREFLREQARGLRHVVRLQVLVENRHRIVGKVDVLDADPGLAQLQRDVAPENGVIRILADRATESDGGLWRNCVSHDPKPLSSSFPRRRESTPCPSRVRSGSPPARG